MFMILITYRIGRNDSRIILLSVTSVMSRDTRKAEWKLQNRRELLGGGGERS